MPSIIVRTAKLDREIKEKIGPLFNDAVHSLLKVGLVEIFFEEHELYYINGAPGDEKSVTFAMEGPPLEESAKAELAQKLDTIYRLASGIGGVQTTFVYHANKPDSIASNGMLHSKRIPIQKA